jgi:hypothetical protein
MNKIDSIMDFVANNFNATRWGATDALRTAIEQALAVQPKQEPDYEVSDEENEQFSLDVSNFKGADPEATKYALEQFLKNRTHPQPKQEPVALAEQYARSHAKFLFKAPQPQPKQEPTEYDHGPQAATLAEAERDVRKWLNERPSRPLDLRHVAMLAYHAQQWLEEPQPYPDHFPDARKMIEPFGFFRSTLGGWEDCAETDEGARPLYEGPQPDHFADAGKPMEREWVDLPPEEIKALANLPGADRERTAVEMAYAVQAKLRERNT